MDCEQAKSFNSGSTISTGALKNSVFDQSKTGNELFLPLVPAVGDALLNYLRRGRPQTEIREVFLHARAPLGPFRGGLSVIRSSRIGSNRPASRFRGDMVRTPSDSQEPSACCAEQVPVKSIGDLLGHRSAESTEVYLRLATDDLRADKYRLACEKENHDRTGRIKTER